MKVSHDERNTQLKVLKTPDLLGLIQVYDINIIWCTHLYLYLFLFYFYCGHPWVDCRDCFLSLLVSGCGVHVCVDLPKRSKTCTWSCPVVFFHAFDSCLKTNHCHAVFTCFWFDLVVEFQNNLALICRGHRPVVDTCANEAIPQWGKHDLISHVYLQKVSMVMKQCLVVLPWFSCWKSCCFQSWTKRNHAIETRHCDAYTVLFKCVCVCAFGEKMGKAGLANTRPKIFKKVHRLSNRF